MMVAVHRYEGTVNRLMGDGLLALFGAPIAHEDHAVRACYAALAIQAALRRYSDEVRRTHGLPLDFRVGLNSGDVVVRAIDNDLHMDYSAIGQTVHLAARMEQLATPGSILLTPATLRLVEGLVRVNALGPIPVKGLTEPVEVFELVGASAVRQRLQASARTGAYPLGGTPDRTRERWRRRWSGRARGTARWWPRWGRPAWGSLACSTSSSTPTAPRAGACWRRRRCRTAKPRPTSRWWSCSSATCPSKTGTSRKPSRPT